MPLRISKGNMYPWVTHTWNPIFGRCSHQCEYCYMRQDLLPRLQLKAKELLKTKLGTGKTIFVGSATDMFAADVPGEWIARVLRRCRANPGNTYLFQSKNPQRFEVCRGYFPPKTILGTTIESNRNYLDTKAPPVRQRVASMQWMSGMRRTVTVEPIMDFDLEPMVNLIRACEPEFVSIGADSKGHKLTEPPYEKVQQLALELNRFTEIRVKHNLDRLIPKP